MKCGGVSLKGKHAINQDSFSALKVHGGYVVAVSDGLGSRPRSQAGSAALCQVACEVARFTNAGLKLWQKIIYRLTTATPQH